MNRFKKYEGSDIGWNKRQRGLDIQLRAETLGRLYEIFPDVGQEQKPLMLIRDRGPFSIWHNYDDQRSRISWISAEWQADQPVPEIGLLLSAISPDLKGLDLLTDEAWDRIFGFDMRVKVREPDLAPVIKKEIVSAVALMIRRKVAEKAAAR